MDCWYTPLQRRERGKRVQVGGRLIQWFSERFPGSKKLSIKDISRDKASRKSFRCCLEQYVSKVPELWRMQFRSACIIEFHTLAKIRPKNILYGEAIWDSSMDVSPDYFWMRNLQFVAGEPHSNNQCRATELGGAPEPTSKRSYKPGVLPSCSYRNI